jgi:nitric oxide synthase oxygenase domain/subunit
MLKPYRLSLCFLCTLQVLDARHASTPKDMFEAILHHIRFANNGGNLRYFRHIIVVLL